MQILLHNLVEKYTDDGGGDDGGGDGGGGGVGPQVVRLQ